MVSFNWKALHFESESRFKSVPAMTKTVSEISNEICALSPDEKAELLRLLIAELDSPADPEVEQAWLETSQRRYRELVEGKVQGGPGPKVR